MKTVRAIAFDAFDTLIQYGLRLAPYSHLYAAGGELVDKLPLLTRDASMATFATELDLVDHIPTMEIDLAEELGSLRLYADVPAVLAKARVAGLRLAVCSNLASEYGPPVRGLLSEMDAYVLSFEVGVAKPHPTMFRLVCAELGCAPDEVVFVGDSKRCDYDGPQAFGMQARWLNRRGGQSLPDALAGVL